MRPANVTVRGTVGCTRLSRRMLHEMLHGMLHGMLQDVLHGMLHRMLHGMLHGMLRSMAVAVWLHLRCIESLTSLDSRALDNAGEVTLQLGEVGYGGIEP